jgi:hypothetical protein
MTEEAVERSLSRCAGHRSRDLVAETLQKPYISYRERLADPSDLQDLRSNQTVLNDPSGKARAWQGSYNDKQRRCFQRAMSGLLKASFAGHRCTFLTLTSGKGSYPRELSANMQVLRKRIEHEFGVLYQYIRVRTSEGNGVLHLLLVADVFIPQKWISDAWRDITQGVSYIVFIEEVHLGRKSDCKKMSRYMTQYVAGQQNFERYSMSRFWLFPSAVKVWKALVHSYGMRDAILRFESILRYPLVVVVDTVFDVLGSLIVSGQPYRVIGG